MAPRRTDPTPPSRTGTQGEIATGADGSSWQWVDGALGANGVLGVGGGSWVQVSVAPSTTTGTTSPGGVPTGRAADPPATPTATTGGASTDGTPPPSYETAPTGVDDNALAQWLQQHAIGMDAEIARLSTAEDDAALVLQTALASGDPEAIRGATAGVQQANQRLKAAQTAQAGYFTQLQPVQARLDKVDARNDPQAKEERQQRMLALQSQIDANAAQQRLADARLKKEMNPYDAIAARALQQAQTNASKAQTALATVQATAYPATAAAGVRASDATAAEAKARTDEINALIAAGMPKAQAEATVAQGEASRAATAVSAEDLHQKQIGELGTYAEQLQKQVDAGVLTQAQARGMLQAKSDELATGATAYTRQSQTAANSLAFAQEAQRQGTLVNMGQQYATGGEPGGFYSQASQQLGFGPTSYALHPTPLPQAIQALGADVNTPYTTAQLGMPAQGAQAGQQAAAGAPPAVQGLGTAQVNWTALTFQQAKALLRGNGAATPQQPPVQSVPVMHGGGTTPGPMGV